MGIKLPNPDLDRHQNGKSDPARHQNDTDPQHDEIRYLDPYKIPLHVTNLV